MLFQRAFLTSANQASNVSVRSAPCSCSAADQRSFAPLETPSVAYLRDTLAKIAEGHPISRIDELMPWKNAIIK